jgi:putative phosphoribosyl transferase
MAHQELQLDFEIEVDRLRLPGIMQMPSGDALGIVLFAHGSGSGRLSPRNQAVASSLVHRGCATLLFDLLTEEESRDRRNVFDIALLGSRMIAATQEAQEHELSRDLPIGYFGASTGAAAALVAAAKLGETVSAVVSRGGRPDLAGPLLAQVTAPTLLLVGSLDVEVLELNRMAQRQMINAECNLTIIPGASHLFEEPGTLEQVAEHAGRWFVRQFQNQD